jgi:uncharacterized protein (TIGR00290 family)
MESHIADQSREKSVLVSWSGGKDSCMALREVQRTPNIRVEALLTTITCDFDRISMHGVRRVLLEQQAASLGIPLHQIFISKGASNEEYEAAMGKAFSQYRDRGINAVVFGNLFLEDIRAYRERLITKHNMASLYPVWGRDTSKLIKDFISLGFKSAIVCGDPAKLDPSFVGRVIDDDLLTQLPPQVDPCCENGEFHTLFLMGQFLKTL